MGVYLNWYTPTLRTDMFLEEAIDRLGIKIADLLLSISRRGLITYQTDDTDFDENKCEYTTTIKAEYRHTDDLNKIIKVQVSIVVMEVERASAT